MKLEIDHRKRNEEKWLHRHLTANYKKKKENTQWIIDDMKEEI